MKNRKGEKFLILCKSDFRNEELWLGVVQQFDIDNPEDVSEIELTIVDVKEERY